MSFAVQAGWLRSKGLFVTNFVLLSGMPMSPCENLPYLHWLWIWTAVLSMLGQPWLLSRSSQASGWSVLPSICRNSGLYVAFVSQRCGSVWCHPDDEDKTGSDMSFFVGCLLPVCCLCVRRWWISLALCWRWRWNSGSGMSLFWGITCTLSLCHRGMDRFSTILEITMKLKSEISGDTAARIVSDFLTEQQVSNVCCY